MSLEDDGKLFTDEHQARALQAIREERRRQDAKWGVQNHGDAIWLTILVEEVGELAAAILEQRHNGSGSIHGELTQVAAVALAWMECHGRYGKA